jgi:hypothetical protein
MFSGILGFLDSLFTSFHDITMSFLFSLSLFLVDPFHLYLAISLVFFLCHIPLSLHLIDRACFSLKFLCSLILILFTMASTVHNRIMVVKDTVYLYMNPTKRQAFRAST